MRAVILLCCGFLTGCGSELEGRYQGEMSRSGSVTRPSAGSDLSQTNLGETHTGVTVEVTRSGDDYIATWPGCRLKGPRDARDRNKMSGMGECVAEVEGQRLSFDVQGSVAVIDDKLTLNIGGGTGDLGYSGGLTWGFSGRRQ